MTLGEAPYLGPPNLSRNYTGARLTNSASIFFSFAGCAFLTYVERASAEKAQKALHERITLPGVSKQPMRAHASAAASAATKPRFYSNPVQH